jgi:hypothetical protein
MPEYKDSATVPVDLKPLHALIKANIEQLRQAEQTVQVKKALDGLKQAKKSIGASCPHMFFRVAFNRQHD